MNTQLEKLFIQYSLSPKDRYEINQMFMLLPGNKQHNLLKNFPKLVSNIRSIQEDIRVEQELLLGGLYQDIDQAIERERRRRLVLNK